MVGRGPERTTIDGVLDAAASGASAVLAVRGEAGIGKTLLLDYASAQAIDIGGRSASVSGFAGETAIPYAVLSDLCRPFVPLLEDIPAPQATALRGVLALGPP